MLFVDEIFNVPPEFLHACEALDKFWVDTFPVFVLIENEILVDELRLFE